MSSHRTNNESFNDPVIRVKDESASGATKKQGTRRFQIPLFGVSGLSFFIAWLAMTMLSPQTLVFISVGAGALHLYRMVFLAAMVATSLMCFACAKQLSKAGVPLALMAFLLSPWCGLSVIISILQPIAVVFWILGGISAGLFFQIWMWHLCAFSNQRQVIMAIGCSLLLGSLIFLLGSLFRSFEACVFTIILPIGTLGLYCVAGPRVNKRAAQLAENPCDERDTYRFVFKESIISSCSFLVFGFMAAFSAEAAQPIVGMFVVSVAFIVAGAFMVFVLLHFTRSAAYIFLGTQIPSIALAVILFALDLPGTRIAALAINGLNIGILLVLHESNVASNSRKMFGFYTKGASYFLAVDGLFTLLGWSAYGLGDLLPFDAASHSIVLLVLFAIFASGISFCLFAASPESRHVPYKNQYAETYDNSIKGFLSSIMIPAHAEASSTDVINISLDGGEQEPAAEVAPRKSLYDIVDEIAQEASLSPREADVLLYLARGHNAQSVAEKLTVSVNTTKTHIRNIYAKLNVHSQQELVDAIDKRLSDAR